MAYHRIPLYSDRYYQMQAAWLAHKVDSGSCLYWSSIEGICNGRTPNTRCPVNWHFDSDLMRAFDDNHPNDELFTAKTALDKLRRL